MSRITSQETEAIVQAWQNRAKAQGYKPGTKTYAKLELEYFVGAIVTLRALGRSHPDIWDLLMLSGRSISATLCPENSAQTSAEGKE
jgi:hypothetical protein